MQAFAGMKKVVGPEVPGDSCLFLLQQTITPPPPQRKFLLPFIYSWFGVMDLLLSSAYIADNGFRISLE